FIQAEDGIRDFHVTGVQTCALPISPGKEQILAIRLARQFTNAPGPSKWSTTSPDKYVANPSLSQMSFHVPQVTLLPNHWCASSRSEERRVGKECKARW